MSNRSGVQWQVAAGTKRSIEAKLAQVLLLQTSDIEAAR